MLLGEILVRQGKLTSEQLATALEQQRSSTPHSSLGSLLIERGIVTETDILTALAEQYGFDVLPVVGDDVFDASLVAKLPVEWSRTQGMLPIRWKGRPAVLTSDPSAFAARDDLAVLLRCELDTVLAPRSEIAKAIERFYYQRQESAEDLLRDMETDRPTPAAPRRATSDDLLRIADQAPVTQLVNVILLEALKARASDVHVEPYEKTLRVRYRIDGLLYEQASPPKDLEAALVSRLKVMAHLDIAEKRLPQDGTARVRVGDREIDIRVSTIPVAEGERVVLRLLHRESALLPLEQLGMPDNILTSFRSILREPNGVVLVTGPTGSGKTTTLYAALQELDTRHANVLTIEDPVEYQLPNIGQMQVKPKIGLTFAQGLRHILRQDPDVILVGETRDHETAEIVIRASLTGHLVFSTLHTNDAPGAVIRFLDMGMEPYLIASAIKASLAQRLVRTLCPACKAEVPADSPSLAALGRLADRVRGRTTWKAVGCGQCLGGYRGRTGIYEFMLAGPALQEGIRSHLSAQEFRQQALQLGMRTLLDNAVEKALQGTTSMEEVMRAVGQSSDGMSV